MSKIKRLADLQQDSRNANKGTARGQKQIVGSIQRNGFGRSGLLDKDGRIIAGNKTTEAAAEVFGVESEPIIVQSDGKRPVYVQRVDLDLGDPDPNNPARRLAYEDNVASWLSFELDPEIVMADIEAGFNFEAIDLTLPELGEMLEGSVKELLGGNGSPKDAEPKIDQAQQLKEKWGTESGQVWELGEHRIVCGDCTDPAVVEMVMRGERADQYVTDPPYGVSYADKNEFLNAISPGNRIQVPIENDHLSPDEIKEVWRGAFKNAYNFTTNQASFYLFMPQGGDQMMMMMMMMMSECWIPRHELIWLKNNHVLGRADYAYKHEPILYGWKRDGTHKYYGGFQTSILEYDKPQKSDLHPTTKPVPLLTKLIENNTKRGGVVLDSFLGSGTTLIACENLKRKCRGIEIDPGYLAVTLERWHQLTGKEPIRLSE